jgi:hypothetical protein
MRKVFLLPCVAAAIAVALSTGACFSTPESVDPFVSLASSGVELDFTPLASPEDALAKADLVVEGTLTSVIEGISLRFPEVVVTQQHANSYMTLVVTVDRVVSGDPAKVVDGRVYLAVLRNATVSIDELAALNGRPRLVAVLDDISTWTPAKSVQVVRPAAMPSGAPLYAPYSDGFWLQDAADPAMRGLHAHPEQLAPSWGGVRTVDEVAATLRTAAAHR